MAAVVPPAPGGDPRGVKRALETPNQNTPAAKRSRTSATPPTKKKKKRVVQDPTALFLLDPSKAPNGILDIGAHEPGMAPPRNTVPLLRVDQSAETLRAPEPNGDAVRRATLSSMHVHERPLIELLGSVHMPAIAGASPGPGTSLHGVPLEETLLTMNREFNSRIETMIQARLARNLPTGLDRATDSVRLSSGVIGVGAVATAVELGLTEAERTHRAPPLVGLPAMTLAKTRETWRPNGQLINTHGFAHENLRRQTVAVTQAHNADRAKLFAAFFANDADPVEAAAAPQAIRGPKPPPMRPEDFAMYHQLRREHTEHFARRAEFLSTAAQAEPRPEDKEVERDFLDMQRFPARGAAFGEEPCKLGNNCCVMEMARRLGATIDGPPPALRMPHEIEAFARDGTMPTGGNGLCVDDELKRLTKAAYSPAANLEEDDHALNRFTVRCEKGINNYDPRFALPNLIAGVRKTGIVGFVPHYLRAYRQFQKKRRPDDPTGVEVRYLADVTPNF